VELFLELSDPSNNAVEILTPFLTFSPEDVRFRV
jgi:hypothetical protein